MPHHHHTFRDYLDVEKTSRSIRYQYLDGDIWVITTLAPEHAAVCAALNARLLSLTADGPCRAYTSDLGIRVRATGLATHADAAIMCGTPQRDDESPIHFINPTILFEVFSPGSEMADREGKREHYQQIESLREYVVIAQNRPHAERWSRDEAGGWNHQVIGADGEVVLESIGGSFPLADLYNFSTTSPSTYAS